MLTLEIGVETKEINGCLYRACSGEGKTHIISLVSSFEGCVYESAPVAGV